MEQELNMHDLKVLNEILKAGKDVIIRKTSSGISILSQKTELKKRKDFPKNN